MADGDYERGRSRELALYAARLKKWVAERPFIFVLNGWAARHEAWGLCSFLKGDSSPRVFSYVEQMDGVANAAFEKLPPQAKVIVVGWSMGGTRALMWAARHPEKIAGLILLAATPCMMEDESWRGMNARRIEALHRGLELTGGEGFSTLPPGAPNPYILDAPENLARGLDFLRQTDVREDLIKTFEKAPATFPVFIFQSERDGVVRPENAQFLASIFPAAKVTYIPGGEHALPIFIPNRIDEAVSQCLKEYSKQQKERR